MALTLAALTPAQVAYTAAGGVLPALFWLWFWLREDRLHPEPRGLITRCFLAGAAGTLIAVELERQSVPYLGTGLPYILGLATIEEIVKFTIAYAVALRNAAFDEPVDALMYLITVALGFAAFENVLFLFKTLLEDGANAALLIGNIRFVGPTLLHIVASAVAGTGLALAFRKPRAVRAAVTGLALTAAIALHAVFNFFILEQGDNALLVSLVLVWFSVLLLLLLFEKVKQLPIQPIQPPHP